MAVDDMLYNEYGLRGAGFFKRTASLIIDLLFIQFALLPPFQKLLLRLVPTDSSFSTAFALLSENTSLAKTLSSILIGIGFLTLLYFALFQYYLAQTPGMMLFGLKVVNSSELQLARKRTSIQASKRVPFVRCLLRNLFSFPVFPLYVLWLIEPISLLLDRKKQRLFEKLTSTMTIESYRTAQFLPQKP